MLKRGKDVVVVTRQMLWIQQGSDFVLFVLFLLNDFFFLMTEVDPLSKRFVLNEKESGRWLNPL